MQKAALQIVINKNAMS